MDTLGAALGPFAALILLHFYPNDFTLIFLVAFIPSIAAVAFTFLIKDKPVQKREKLKSSYKDFWISAPSQYKSLIILITVFSLVNSSDVFLILKSQNISNSNFLAILGYIFYNLVYAFTSYPMGKLSDNFGKRNVFIIGMFVFSLVYIGFAFSSSFYIVWILFALYGIYAAATEGVAKAWVSDLIPDSVRGTGIGLLTMLSSIAMMIGSFIAGFLWDQFGAQAPFLISSVVSFLIAVLFLIKKN